MMSDIEEQDSIEKSEETVENPAPEGAGDGGPAESPDNAGEGESVAPESEPEPLSLEAEVEKWKDVAARSQADLENYRKRMAREKADAYQYGNTQLLISLLPVIDNFEMGLKAAQDEGEQSIIYQGMVMVQKQFFDFLSENRVEWIEVAPGGEFDPNLHEAIQQEFSDSVPEGKVIATLRKGYRLKDRLLRPANVIVSKGEAANQEEGEEK